MLELTEEDWDRIVDVNQRGLFFCLQAVAAPMIREAPEESGPPASSRETAVRS